MIRLKTLLLLLILLLAFALRFYRLPDYPAFNADEAAIGYNAYSLLETGKDEHGNSWPIHFQSFNDYKPGLYVYIVLPFIKLLGLNEWAVRIPGALFGVATVLVMYFLANELFGRKKLAADTDYVALSASLLLAVNPWHIHFSRGGWEVNVATFFITFGVLLFLKGTEKHKFYLFSFLSFILALYTYHSARIIVPLIGTGLLLFYWKSVRENLKPTFIYGLISIVILLPLIFDVFRSNVFSRAAGVGIFADPGPLNRINEQRGEHEEYTGASAKLLHNKIINYLLAFFENWGEHYHGEFLFLSGDAIQRNKVPETGQLYLFDIFLLLFGFLILMKVPKTGLFVIFWLLITPIASALTFQSPHSLRSHNMVIPLMLISSVGLCGLIAWLRGTFKDRSVRAALFLSITVFIGWQFARYQHMYWVHMAKEYPFSSQYGLKELVSYTEDEGEGSEKIVVTDRYDQPYILFLFYGAAVNPQKYSPSLFQANHTLSPRDEFGFSTVRAFDKYEFRSINFDEERLNSPNSLIVGTDEEIPDEANIVKEIYGTNGYKYFQVVAN